MAALRGAVMVAVSSLLILGVGCSSDDSSPGDMGAAGGPAADDSPGGEGTGSSADGASGDDSAMGDDSSGDGDDSSSGATGGADGQDTEGQDGEQPAGDSNPVDDEPVGDDLQLLFDPMYSAYDGVHEFKIPVIVQGIQDVDWSARPPEAVDIEPDSTTGGVLLTTRQPGTVQIIARAGVLSGSAMLHVTDATPEDWETGEARYNNEIPFPDIEIPDGGLMSGMDGVPSGIEIPDDLSCVNCHGSGAEFLDVEHTPQQTGGYSDEELISIFTMGTKPEGAGFHTPFPEYLYTMFHTWNATPQEQKGIVVYLRSLTPKTQGDLDFQGLRDMFMPSGGM